ncbi:MAG: FliH/SctL family protein [Candidatus Brocadiaceae bacterium]|uniref:FliH/SctL family protein n=1 Tax=Candidatus Wunengus sp. YC61 TaxID=3367698 RepID=UPI0027201123|nr:FliH/SctL family protein [Candidatus Brocadiaceae bacterium]
MKNKKVYASPDVKGIYVLQSLRYQSKSHHLDETTEWETKEKSDEEERLSALEIAKDEAYKKGRLDAEQDFKREIEKIKSEYASLMALFQNAVNQLIDKREKIWQESELEIIKLILTVSSKMVGEEISNKGKDVIKYVVKEALSHVSGKKIVAVRLSPDDAKKINLLEEMKLLDPNIKILEDGTITSGGCIIETDFGSIDCQIETRWEEIRKTLVENKNESTVH